ncbi:30S ribosomal protein S9 [Candidatus Parcubacteria bacterium]|nr:30S ribosomal protein S9 [Candidatus Parcubacteria bacterium]
MPEVTGTTTTATKTRTKKKADFISGTGRRKRAVARVWLYPNSKKGFTVNEKPIAEYFPGDQAETIWTQPFFVVGISHPESHFSASIKVAGSGKSSQLDAIVLGFSRALIEFKPEFRPMLRKAGLLTRDSREKERKKYFLRKARKRPQYSKR